jgi:hypothetical protein
MLSKRAVGLWRRIALNARADDGMALATVMSIAAILFILVTTLIMLATQQSISAGSQVQRNKALAAADAGLNDYLYRLSKDPEYWRSTPDQAGASTDSTWTVHAERPGGSGPVFLTATGATPKRGNVPGARRVVKASVKSPTFADYTFMVPDLNIGSGALFKGNVRSNSSIVNAGTITGNAYAHTTISGSGSVLGKKYPNCDTLSFAVVDYGKLESIATTDGTNFEGLPEYESVGGGAFRKFWGYSVKLTGSGGTINPVRAVDPDTGVLTIATTQTTNFTIPTEGVLYFDSPLWVSGTYSAKLTIVTLSDVHQAQIGSDYCNIGSSGFNNSSVSVATLTNKANSAVYLPADLVPDDPQSDQVCGIVAQGDISVPSSYNSMPSTIKVSAAMLSTKGSIHGDMASGQTKTKFHMEGALASFLGYNYFTGGTMGFNSRDYWYDARLNATPPPNFPPLGDGTLRVQSWVEQ